MLCLYLGFQPKPLTDAMQGSIDNVLAVYPATVRQFVANGSSTPLRGTVELAEAGDG